jgi:hypothetical protein
MKKFNKFKRIFLVFTMMLMQISNAIGEEKIIAKGVDTQHEI